MSMHPRFIPVKKGPMLQHIKCVTLYTCTYMYTELILGSRPANERRRYKVTPSLIGWAQT